MLAVIGNALGFALIIVIGYAARRLHVVDDGIRRGLPALMLSITLPASIISNLNGSEIPPGELYFLALGALFNVTALALGWVLGRARGDSAFLMVSTAGFNIGCFAMPFVQGLFPAHAIVQASLFDIGNSLMCLGLNYGIIAGVVRSGNGGSGLSLRSMARSVVRSVPVMTYFFMLVLCCAGFELPSGVAHAVDIAGRANPFIAMMVIGVSIEFTASTSSASSRADGGGVDVGVSGVTPEHPHRAFAGRVAQCCLLRLANSAAAAAVISLLPIPLAAKGVAICLVFAPIGAVSSVYARRLNLDDGMAACINSCYVPISIIAMSAVIACLGLAAV